MVSPEAVTRARVGGLSAGMSVLSGRMARAGERRLLRAVACLPPSGAKR